MVRDKDWVHSTKGLENHGMKFRFNSLLTTTEMQNVIIIIKDDNYILSQLAPDFVLHAIVIHKRVILPRFLKPLSLQRTVKSTERWGEVLPLNWTQLLNKPKTNSKKKKRKNSLVLTVNNSPSKSKYVQLLSMILHWPELTRLKQLLSRVKERIFVLQLTWVVPHIYHNWCHLIIKEMLHYTKLYISRDCISWHTYKVNLFFTCQSYTILKII